MPDIREEKTKKTIYENENKAPGKYRILLELIKREPGTRNTRKEAIKEQTSAPRAIRVEPLPSISSHKKSQGPKRSRETPPSDEV